MWLYVLLVVMWAFVLVPMWLRSHDRSSQTRSADRFSRALGILARSEGDVPREQTVNHAGRRAIVMPGRTMGESRPEVVAHVASATPAARAARRRRIVLMVLLVMLSTVAIAAFAMSRVSPMLVTVPGALTVMFLVSSQRQVARSRSMAVRRARRAALAEAARTATAARADQPLTRRGSRVLEVNESEPIGDAMTSDGSLGSQTRWTAVRTTLPTYVTAPTATRVPRAIDREVAGDWGSTLVERARATRHDEAADSDGMRVETFEIRVPLPRRIDGDWGDEHVQASYDDLYVDTRAGSLADPAADEVTALLDDPRSGVTPRLGDRRRAAG